MHTQHIQNCFLSDVLIPLKQTFVESELNQKTEAGICFQWGLKAFLLLNDIKQHCFWIFLNSTDIHITAFASTW